MKKRLYFEPKAEIIAIHIVNDILQSSTESSTELLDKKLNIRDGLSDRIVW